jgi:hypothetical protein
VIVIGSTVGDEDGDEDEDEDGAPGSIRDTH